MHSKRDAICKNSQLTTSTADLCLYDKHTPHHELNLSAEQQPHKRYASNGVEGRVFRMMRNPPTPVRHNRECNDWLADPSAVLADARDEYLFM